MPGLPPATQEGKNTFDFLLNGESWTPQGFNGTANLNIDYDSGIDDGVCGISSYRIITSDNRQYFGIGIADSVNYIHAPFTVKIRNSSLGRLRFEYKNCSYFSTDVDTYVDGEINITIMNRVKRIIAGRFNVVLHKQGCDTVKITEGRFDMKF